MTNLNTYLVDLTRWGIKNDGTNPLNTSKAINQMLQWASANNITNVTFPIGIYLIHETTPIELPSRINLNLNGSTFQMNPNSLVSYKVFNFDKDQEYCRISNGYIRGERDLHDYSSGQTHEGGFGVNITSNCKYIYIDNCEISNFTGDGVHVITTFGQIVSSFAGTMEIGTYDNRTGNPINDSTRIRSTMKISLTNSYQDLAEEMGYFGLTGDGWGGLGTDITAKHYDVFFYRSDHSFISSITNNLFFDMVTIPTDAEYALISLHQSKLPLNSGINIMARVPKIPKNCFFERCNIHNNRRQGLSLGGQFIYVRDCEIHHIGGPSSKLGTDPQGGIDIEDGYDLNQYFFVTGNYFHHNWGYDIVAKSTRNLFISNNRFSENGKYLSLAITQGVDRALITENYFHQCRVSYIGEVIASSNFYYGCQVVIESTNPNDVRTCLVSNSIFEDSIIMFNKMSPYRVSIENCKFINTDSKHSTFNYSQTFSIRAQPQIIRNCSFKGTDRLYFAYYPNPLSTANGWIISGCSFEGIKSGFLKGKYTNCSFTKMENTIINDIEFDNCSFKSIVSGTLFTINDGDITKLLNCHLELKDGTAIRVQNLRNSFVMVNGSISYPNGSLNSPAIKIEDSFSGSNIIIDGVHFSSSNVRNAIENYTTIKEIIIRNNNIVGMTVNLENKEIKTGNIINNEIDPYYSLNSVPTRGYFHLGQIIRNSIPNLEPVLGWICIEEGYADKGGWEPSKIIPMYTRIVADGHIYQQIIGGAMTAKIPPLFNKASGSITVDISGLTNWSPSTNYKQGDQILPPTENGLYYECTIAGKSGLTPPNFPTTISSTFTDGTVTWKCVRYIAKWKEIGKQALFRDLA